MNMEMCNLARFSRQPSSKAKCTIVVLGIFLLTSLVSGAATTHLFENLQKFGLRLVVGDPDLTPANTTDGPKDIAVADFNGDNHPDLAVANKDGSITLYFGLGNGHFTAPQHLHAGADELRGIVCADLTGDGKVDIAVGAPYTNVFYLFVNAGNGTFGDPVTIPAWHGARDLAAGDFDGDGLMDLAIAGGTNGVAHLRSLGGGSFELRTNITSIGPLTDVDFPQPAFYLKAFRPLGINRDELIVARAQKNKVWELALSAEGNLAIQDTLTNMSVNALDVGPLLHAVSSQLPDLITSHNSRGVLEIHAGNNLIGRFSQNTNQVIAIAGGPRNVRIIDLDGDGWNDLVVVQQSFDKVTTFRNVQGIFVPFGESPVGTSPREMDIGDFNGDGYPDVAVLNRFSSDVSILTTYAGTPGFGTLENVYAVDGNVSGLELRDVNGDGLADVVQLHAASGEMSIRLSQSDGTLGEPTYYPGAGPRPIGKVFADVNNDGIDDVIETAMGPYVTVRMGLGGGNFGTATNYGLPDPVPTTGFPFHTSGTSAQLFSVEAADLDGDGNLDLIVGFWDCRVGFYRGHGDGTFTFTRSHVLFSEPRAITAGDFDNDGDMDFAVTSFSTWAVIENRGDLLTTTNLTKHIYDNGLPSVSTVKIIDYNNDGRPDLLMSGEGGTKLYQGALSGLSFREVTNSYSLPGFNASSLVTADLNGDGYGDLARACADRSCISISFADALGHFTSTSNYDVPSSRYLAVGDIDGDGLPDLVGTGDTLWIALSSRPYTNKPPAALPSPRRGADHLVINEFLALNNNLPLDADAGRISDWLELYNGSTSQVSVAGWQLMAVRTNVSGIATTNQYGVTNTFTATNTAIITNLYTFPSTNLAPGAHLLLVCTDKVRSSLHTGFGLASGGGLLCLIDNTQKEVDRVQYGGQAADISLGRYRDGMASLVSCNFPTPGAPNTDGGNVPPSLDFNGLDFDTIQADTPFRFYAHAEDDVAVMAVQVIWQRLDVPDTEHHLFLMDDGLSGDGGLLDGVYSGVMREGLPAGASIQFYLQCQDIDGAIVTAPSNPSFVAPGQAPNTYTISVPIQKPSLEISEIVADNKNGYSPGSGHPDWLEIRNTSGTPVSLSGISVSKKLFGSGERLSISNTVQLAPYQHLVIIADNTTNATAFHAPFTISKDGDQIVLCATDANGARLLVDSVSFGLQQTDVAWSRFGVGGPWRKAIPTPGFGNIAGTWETLVSSNGNFTLGFPSTNGFNYIVEYKDALTNTTWLAMPAMSGDGIEKTITQQMLPQRYYRVRQQ